MQVKEANQSAPQNSPASCLIEATIVNILDPEIGEKNDRCTKYSCFAIVHVNKIVRCGSSANVFPDENGDIKVKFAYSLSPTTKIFPDLKPDYPGLMKGSNFSALVNIHIAIADKLIYTVYGYEVR